MQILKLWWLVLQQLREIGLGKKRSDLFDTTRDSIYRFYVTQIKINVYAVLWFQGIRCVLRGGQLQISAFHCEWIFSGTAACVWEGKLDIYMKGVCFGQFTILYTSLKPTSVLLF